MKHLECEYEKFLISPFAKINNRLHKQMHQLKMCLLLPHNENVLRNRQKS
jgi:hypothetical protein